MSKIIETFSTPEVWSPELEHRDVHIDPLHVELVGTDIHISPRQEPPPYIEIVGDLIGDEAVRDLIGDDEEEEYEEPEETEEFEEPQDIDETPPGDVEDEVPTDPYEDMTDIPEVDSPPNVPYSTAPSETPQPVSPSAVAPAVAATLASNIAANFMARNPATMASIRSLASQARTNPIARQTLKTIAKRVPPKPKKKVPPAWGLMKKRPVPKKPIKKKIQARGRIGIRGEVFMAQGTVSSLATKTVATALAPVAWATHAAGSAVNEVGSFLSKLARKL